MNIKNLFQNAKPKKLNTATRRATMPVAEDYDSDEPNVRLSRAFLVVMLLHVVAVGGIFAFSSLKKNAPAPIETAIVETPSKSIDLPANSRLHIVTAKDNLGSIASMYGLTRNDLETANNLNESSKLQPGDKLIIPAKSTAQPVPLDVQKLLKTAQNPKVEPAIPVKTAIPIVANNKTVKAAEPVTASVANAATNSKIYIVQKGDSPALIAKRQGIKQSDLLTANNITDPRKLQIGQKLVIPQK